MSRIVTAQPLTREAFAEFGDVIDTDWANHYPINGGMTERYHDLAGIEVIGRNARVLISIFRGKPYAFPLELKLVERHPLGSQPSYRSAADPISSSSATTRRTARASLAPSLPDPARA